MNGGKHSPGCPNNNNEQQPRFIICCLVATLLAAMWHLGFILECKRGGEVSCLTDTRCTGMNVKVRKTRNKDQVPREKP